MIDTYLKSIVSKHCMMGSRHHRWFLHSLKWTAWTINGEGEFQPLGYYTKASNARSCVQVGLETYKVIKVTRTYL